MTSANSQDTPSSNEISTRATLRPPPASVEIEEALVTTSAKEG